MSAFVLLTVSLTATLVTSQPPPSCGPQNEAGTTLPEDMDMSVRQMMRYWGYPSTQEYTVQTEDGYKLTVQRLQNKRHMEFDATQKKPVVFLQHGLMSSSGCWVVNLPGQSLAYVLADAGFDVWLGNVRGNQFGQQHVKYTTKQKQFWNFSWADMAAKDLPAMVDFALKTSGQEKLTYIGHSQGTMIAFKHFAEHPEYATAKVSLFIAMAPVMTVGHIQGELKDLSKIWKPIDKAATAWKQYSLTTMIKVLRKLEKPCLVNFDKAEKCNQNYFHNLPTMQPNCINMTRMPLIIGGYPEDTSMKNLAHFAEMIMSDKFEAFNYGGPLRNYLKYKQLQPPTFDVSKIPIKMHLYYSSKDTLATVEDVEMNLLPHLQPYLFNVTKFNDFEHADYCIALSATNRVYDDIIKKINAQ